MKETIGWIGLGELGQPMAMNLLESGYGITVYNRTREKAQQLADRGARVVESALGVAVRGGIVVSVLLTEELTESFVTPEFLARLEGGIHVGMFTGSPEAAHRLSKIHADHGSFYVEAPVFGRPEAAAARELTILYAGLQEAKNRIKPLFTAMGGRATCDMGEDAGTPTVIKQLGNFLIFSAVCSLAEGLAIAGSAGVDKSAAVKVLTESLFPAPIYRNYGNALAENKNPFGVSPLPAKDLGLCSKLAARVDRPSPITRLLLQVMKSSAE